MRNILETTLSGCYKYSTSGFWYWTAGQRIDPSRCSTFIWRVTSTNTYNDTVSTMTYTNWYSLEPDCGTGQTEKCMNLYSRHSYKWNDLSCSSEVCSVCELDIWVHRPTDEAQRNRHRLTYSLLYLHLSSDITTQYWKSKLLYLK